MRDRRTVFTAAVLALLVTHCAWQRDGVGATVAFVSDDPEGARRVLDAAGHEHTLERVLLSVARVSLVRCPGDTAPAPLTALLGPSHARAHDLDEAGLGPLEIDLVADGIVFAGRLAPLPGRYCDVRLAVTGLTVSGDEGRLALHAALDREIVLRIDEQRLLAPGDLAEIALTTTTAGLLEAMDPTAPDPAVDAVRALGAALDGIEASAGPP